MTRPDHIQQFKDLYPNVPDVMLRCPDCGDWWTGIDTLAPYYWEVCYCERCDNQPEYMI